MAIGFDSYANNGGGSTTSWSHTAGGANIALIVKVGSSTGAQPTVTAAYNGISMTQIEAVDMNFWQTTFILLGASSGMHTVSITSTGTVFDACSISYNGVGTGGSTGGCDNHASASGTGTSVSSSFTTNANNCWIVNYGIGQNNAPSGGTITNTSRGSVANAGQFWDSAGAESPDTYAVGLSWSVSQPSLSQTIISLAPFTSGSATGFFLALP